MPNPALPTRFPVFVREQSVVVKIYRVKPTRTPDTVAYVVAWIGPDGRETKWQTDYAEAKEFASLKASQLAAGLAGAAGLNRSDIFELTEARRLAGDIGLPLLSALEELKKARSLAGPALIEAAAAWSERRTSSIDRITVTKAIENFIAEKTSLGKSGERVYGAKLKYLATAFGDRPLDSITAPQYTKFLAQFADPVTRNDIRKRVVTLARWAQANGHLFSDVKPEAEKTQRSKEIARPIGILEPEVFEKLLRWTKAEHPEYLAGVVLAGLCGVRIDEIHGKFHARDRRQLWEHIHLDRGFLSVSAAKENTPSSRIVHLSDAATAWLRLCEQPKGYVCEADGMEKWRWFTLRAKPEPFKLPSNCLRHSYISYRIALTGDKQSTATEAGNSVKEIDRRYRVPLPKFLGKQWFSILPGG